MCAMSALKKKVGKMFGNSEQLNNGWIYYDKSS